MKLALLAAAALAAVAATPSQALTYAFNYVSTGAAPLTASGQFVTSNYLNGNGSYDILSISGNVAGDTITALVVNPNQPNASFSADGLFYYDNVYTPGDPIITNAGILFNSVGGFEYNFFSDAPGVYELYQAVPFGGYTQNSVGVLTATFVPEPATWGLMIVGFGMVGVAARRRKTAVAA